MPGILRLLLFQMDTYLVEFTLMFASFF